MGEQQFIAVWVKMAKAVKLADIAAKVNVSTVTVSKALSGQKGVSETVREQIIQIANEMGYKQPSVYRKEAENRAKQKSYNIGVLIAEYYLGKYESFYSQMYQKFAANAGNNGSFCMLEIITSDAEREVQKPMMISERRVDGIVLIGRVSDEYLKMIVDSEIPVVFMDFYTSDTTLDFVISDSFYGAYQMTNYLLDKGHKDIAFVGTIGATPSITDRYMGYAKSMTERNIELRKEWIINDRDEKVKVLKEECIKLPENMPTAFVCNSDQTAGILIKILTEKGYRVPEDISVVGFDNFLPPGICNVRITSYEVDMKEMAKRTLKILQHKISGEKYKQGILVVGGHLVEKDSVKNI